jgi:phage tail-like protein
MKQQLAEFLFDQVGMSHRFVVRIDRGDYDLGTWTKVAGLTVNWNRLTYRAGEHTHEHVFPGNVSYQTIKLSRAACTDSATVQDWLSTTATHRESLSGGIYMLDFIGLPVITWELKEFFPIGWSISDFDSTAGRPAMETLELAHNGFLHAEAKAEIE